MSQATIGRPRGFEPSVVVVAQLSFIGDMVFTTPLLDEIKQRWPRARLVVAGRPRALEVLEDHPAVDRYVVYDKDDRQRGTNALLAVGRRLREEAPDLFFGVTRSLRTAILAALSGASLTVGFQGGGRGVFYDLLADRDDAATPFPQRPLALLAPFGGHPPPRPLHLAVSLSRRQEAERGLERAGWRGEPLLAIAPGASYATKRWPAHHVSRLIDLVLERTAFRPVLYGGPEEERLIGGLLARREGRVLDRRGIGMRGVTADLSMVSVLLCGDSGPLHIARALGTPVVCLHGPTCFALLGDGRPYRILSLGLDCQPCSPHGDDACPLGHHRCMEEITPEMVLRAIVEEGRR